ncbi:hypothetical protein ES695_13135 [Candidatus Atribacteria bacterium 1244-E10-H5-B2]|nr:MAG: hypothetical protein ES695_13135 [Candidatus Atribacteria bacterium 1244-E10-H5-B2]
MARVKVVIPTGGNLPGESATTTTDFALEIDGTKYVLVPVQVDGKTYYAIAAEGWKFAANVT